MNPSLWSLQVADRVSGSLPNTMQGRFKLNRMASVPRPMRAQLDAHFHESCVAAMAHARDSARASDALEKGLRRAPQMVHPAGLRELWWRAGARTAERNSLMHSNRSCLRTTYLSFSQECRPKKKSANMRQQRSMCLSQISVRAGWAWLRDADRPLLVRDS